MYCFIVNKVSGNGRALKIWNKIERILIKKNVLYCVYYTEKPKHATLIVQELINEKCNCIIVVVGGDGTIHEVLNGLIGSNTPLGIIPAGSGNDFSRGLGISLEHDKALDRILNGESKIIDIGIVNSTYFCTVAGIGFDGEVAYVSNQSIFKKIFNLIRIGHLTYIINTIKVLFQFTPADITVVIDKKIYKFQKVWLVAVANLPFYGGGLPICPKAECTDGLFDICIVHGMTKFQFFRILKLVLKGQHMSSPSIKIIKGTELEINSSTPLMIHGDGEIIGRTPAQIRIEPHSLYVF
ncbi:diacylglycerol/lipid kinase family protein [Metabacillus herbersteinensis]|uniref:Diacylglycerol/lipid kinase family protein n=1 Tax=Metabacillus herbersteinensis TaxID=283816 RepID=A0ABV6GJS5_9BACI